MGMREGDCQNCNMPERVCNCGNYVHFYENADFPITTKALTLACQYIYDECKYPHVTDVGAIIHLFLERAKDILEGNE